MESPADRDKIRRLLGMISTYEHQHHDDHHNRV